MYYYILQIITTNIGLLGDFPEIKGLFTKVYNVILMYTLKYIKMQSEAEHAPLFHLKVGQLMGITYPNYKNGYCGLLHKLSEICS